MRETHQSSTPRSSRIGKQPARNARLSAILLVCIFLAAALVPSFLNGASTKGVQKISGTLPDWDHGEHYSIAILYQDGRITQTLASAPLSVSGSFTLTLPKTPPTDSVRNEICPSEYIAGRLFDLSSFSITSNGLEVGQARLQIADRDEEVSATVSHMYSANNTGIRINCELDDNPAHETRPMTVDVNWQLVRGWNIIRANQTVTQFVSYTHPSTEYAKWRWSMNRQHLEAMKRL